MNMIKNLLEKARTTGEAKGNLPCLKRRVSAIVICLSGEAFYGENIIRNKVEECPRKDMKSGEGYELCESVCAQVGHAEVVAAQSAKMCGADLKGATVFVSGHDYVCKDCQSVLFEEGVALISVLDNDKVYVNDHKKKK